MQKKIGGGDEQKKETKPWRTADGKDPAKDWVGVLAIAYHNMGVE